MGAIYEVLSTPFVYARKGIYHLRRATGSIPAPARSVTRVSFGDDANQAFILYEPAQVTHAATIMYFHGGAYLVGAPESMDIAADVFNGWGYRFVSVGFRLLGAAPFPAQIEDAFCGVTAACSYLDAHGAQDCPVVLGGSSAGGHAAAVLCYSSALQEAYGLDVRRIRGLISMAGVMDADDMLARAPLTHYVELPEGERVVSTPAMPTHTASTPAVSAVSASNAAAPIAVTAATADARHRALAPYSPIELVGERSRVPMLAIHGIHDRMSPYVSERRFVEKLNACGNASPATLHTLNSWRYQHLRLTAAVFTEDPDSSEPLSALSAWLDTLSLD